MKKGFVIYASRTGAKLNADVHTGGGDDDTLVLQAALDKALEWGHLHFVLDGAARVSGLKVHSNTTIECPDYDCGLFMNDHTYGPVLRTAGYDLCAKERPHRNITIKGGTYNHNNVNNRHRAPVTEEYASWEHTLMYRQNDNYHRPNIALEFIGVENLTIQDVAIQDNSAWGMLVSNFRNVNISNVFLDLRNHFESHNQDGLHFWGPGEFLNIRNVYGRSGDDFIALAPDEWDGVSDITDVLIDGLALEHADQCVRMLSRDAGRLDRVTVRNCYGTCTTMGFYINYWFERSERHGNYGTILLENIDLRTERPVYEPAFLFRIGGNVDSLTCRNIVHRTPFDNRPLFDVGYYSCNDRVEPEKAPVVARLTVDGLSVQDPDGRMADAALMRVRGYVERMIVRNVEVQRGRQVPAQGTLLKMVGDGRIESLELDNVRVERMNSVLEAQTGTVAEAELHRVRAVETPLIIDDPAGVVTDVPHTYSWKKD